MISSAGGRKDHAGAKANAIDISKFLHVAATNKAGITAEVDTSHLYNTSKIHDYMNHLEATGIEAAGQLTKVYRLKAALKYMVCSRGMSMKHDQYQIALHMLEGLSVILARVKMLLQEQV